MCRCSRVAVVDAELFTDPSRSLSKRCSRKAWTSESMFSSILADSQDYVLLSTSRGSATANFSQIP